MPAIGSAGDRAKCLTHAAELRSRSRSLKKFEAARRRQAVGPADQ